MASPVTWADLKVFEPDFPEDMALTMISGSWATITRKIAPCLRELDWEDPENEETKEEVKLIHRSALLRWYDKGSGVVGSRNAGEYGETLVGLKQDLFRPSEIRDLQDLCPETKRTGGASTVPTADVDPNPYVVHALSCSISFGGGMCDCGAELSADGYPLWPST